MDGSGSGWKAESQGGAGSAGDSSVRIKHLVELTEALDQGIEQDARAARMVAPRMMLLQDMNSGELCVW